MNALLWIDIVAALYMLVLAVVFDVRNIQSAILFKAVPILIVVLLGYYAAMEAGVVVSFGS